MSFSINCSCRFFVPVEITTRFFVSSAAAIAGIRYAKVLPVPVPASTIRWRLSANACATASAILIWPGAVFVLFVEFRDQPAAAEDFFDITILHLVVGQFEN